jgi:hypothetical protein
MTERREGWYWMKLRDGLAWMAAHWDADGWMFVDCEGVFDDLDVMVVGPESPRQMSPGSACRWMRQRR